LENGQQEKTKKAHNPEKKKEYTHWMDICVNNERLIIILFLFFSNYILAN
jgi:hypothetical protein